MKILILLVSGKIKPLILLVISILCIGCVSKKQYLQDQLELKSRFLDRDSMRLFENEKLRKRIDALEGRIINHTDYRYHVDQVDFGDLSDKVKKAIKEPKK